MGPPHWLPRPGATQEAARPLPPAGRSLRLRRPSTRHTPMLPPSQPLGDVETRPSAAASVGKERGDTLSPPGATPSHLRPQLGNIASRAWAGRATLLQAARGGEGSQSTGPVGRPRGEGKGRGEGGCRIRERTQGGCPALRGPSRAERTRSPPPVRPGSGHTPARPGPPAADAGGEERPQRGKLPPRAAAPLERPRTPPWERDTHARAAAGDGPARREGGPAEDLTPSGAWDAAPRDTAAWDPAARGGGRVSAHRAGVRRQRPWWPCPAPERSLLWTARETRDGTRAAWAPGHVCGHQHVVHEALHGLGP